MTTKDRRPRAFGTGLIALDLVMGADATSPVQSWAGGTCGNVMTILAYLGWNSFPIGRMNGDPASHRVRTDLKRWGVALDFTDCAPTSHTPIIIQQIRRDRHGSPTHRFLWSCPRCGQRLPSYRPVTQHSIETIAPHLAGSAVFFMDRLSRAALSLASAASDRGAVIVYEPSAKSDEKLFAEAMQLAHIVKYSDQRLAAAGGAMHDESATLLEVQTLGSNGLRYRHRLGSGISEWTHLGAINAPTMVDSCGSGDWCTAGLLAKVAANGHADLREATGASIQQALRYGQALAAWNCGFEGARGGMYAVDGRSFEKQIGSILKGRPELSVVPKRTTSDESVACPACPAEEDGVESIGSYGARQSARKVAVASSGGR